MDILYDVNKLFKLLGLNRHDDRILDFINQVDSIPEITIDKEDGADDEDIEFKKKGFGLHFMGDILSSIYFKSTNALSNYSMYQYPLPMGIRFKQTKSEILNLLGEPAAIGGGEDKFFGTIPDWFKYKIDGYTLHIKFTANCKMIQTVRIMYYD